MFDPCQEERWYAIPDCDGYEISSWFRVRSWWRKGAKTNKRSDEPTVRTVSRAANGYLAFRVRIEGKQVLKYVHHIVAALAIGPRPNGMHVLHRDDIKTNNDPANLYYGTNQQNAIDAFKNGRRARGEDRSQAKISAAIASEIRRRYRDGEQQKAIAQSYGISQPLVSRIVAGRMWNDVNPPSRCRT